MTDLVGLTVQQIQERRGVSQRYAYELYQRVNRPPEVDVPAPQKDVILRSIRILGMTRIEQLQPAVQRANGGTVDAHNLVHVIWSLQKQGLLRFRESKRDRTLHAIRLTPKGEEWLDARKEQPMPVTINDEELEERDAQVWGETPPVTGAEQYARETDPFHNNNGYGYAGDGVTGRTGDPDEAPAPPLTSMLTGRPHLRALVERAKVVTQVRRAAAILEEAKVEDEIVLDLYDRYALTPEEEEMITLLETLS